MRRILIAASVTLAWVASLVFLPFITHHAKHIIITANAAALEKLSRMPDCGCRPCTGQCQSVVALKVELQERCDLACAALAAWKEATRG